MKEFHPIALCYPPLSKGKFEALKEDIRANGLLHPIILFDGKILCGVHRERACRELGIEPRYVTPEIHDPYAYAIGDNELRRVELSSSQKAVVAEKMATLKHGGYRGANQYVERGKSSSRRLGDFVKTRSLVAQRFGTSKGQMDKVRLAKKNGGEDFVDAIQNGKVSADEAYNISRLPKAKHEEALQAAIERKPRDTVAPHRRKVPKSPQKVVTPEEAARRQELLERSKRSIPWPKNADSKPIHPDGEIRTQQIRDALVRLRNAEPHIGTMPDGEALRNVFSDTKKFYLFPGTIDPLLKAWSHDVNGKATARERLLYEARQRREDIEADEDNKRLNRRVHKIHGFEAAWTRFEEVLKKALQHSVFCPEDEEQLLSATTEFLTTHFNALRQKAAKSASADNQTPLAKAN